MKQLVTIIVIASVLGLFGCGGAGGNDPGRAYMPDMYYARAYETYGYNNVEGELDSLKKRGIFYSALPVPGTIARGDAMPNHLTIADSVAAKALQNPLDSMAMTKGSMKEAERLYLVNCAICHGSQLDGNGPLYNGGNGPFIAKPADLKAPNIKAFPDGHYYYVITNGIRTMGSYASQLTPDQRWWVIKYIRSKQSTPTTTMPADSTIGNAAPVAGPTGNDTTRTN